MADTKYLKKRGNLWSFHLRVPKNLVGQVGKSEIVEALGTDSLKEAQEARTHYLARYLAKWERLRAAAQDPQPGAKPYLLKLAEELRLNIRHPVFDTGRGIEHEIKGALEVLEDEASGWRKKPSERHAYDDEIIEDAVSIVQTADSSTIYELLDLHCNERAESLRKQTLHSRRARVRHFVEWLGGDAPIESVSRGMAGKYVTEKLLPSPLSLKSCKDYLSDISAVFEWSLHRGYLEMNPFHGQVRSLPKEKRGKATKVHRSWNDSELVKAFHCFESKPAHRSKWLLMALSFFTGLRINEVASLTVENTGVDFLYVRESKTDSSVRHVPLHDLVVPLVSALKAASRDGFLIPDLKPGGMDLKRSHYASKEIGRILHKTLHVSGEVGFHQLRNTLATQLENRGFDIDHSWHQQLLGHSKQSITLNTYSDGVDFKRLKALIDSLDFGVIGEYISKTYPSVLAV